jgi:hypothetical protein
MEPQPTEREHELAATKRHREEEAMRGAHSGEANPPTPAEIPEPYPPPDELDIPQPDPQPDEGDGDDDD